MPACEADGGYRTEHSEDVHQIDVVDAVFRKIERLFNQVESHVIIKADEYPQDQSSGEVEGYQGFGGYQLQVGDD